MNHIELWSFAKWRAVFCFTMQRWEMHSFSEMMSEKLYNDTWILSLIIPSHFKVINASIVNFIFPLQL